MFSNINKIEERRAQWVKDAAELPTGIDPADLETGAKVTLSPNLRVFDRSYTNEVLEVLAVNSHNVQLRRLKKLVIGGDSIIVSTYEHHFYSATNFETV